jgi:hypothetical protein
MDQFYAELNIGKILDEQGKGEGPTLTGAEIHEIGVQAVEKALWSQPDELRPWPFEQVVAGLADNERRLANVG